MDTKQLMNIGELSKRIGVSVNTIYSWVAQRKIPFVKICGTLRFDVGDIERWIDASKEEPADFKKLAA